jgi:signal transduction histidine kinase
MKLATRIIAVFLIVVALFTIVASYFTIRSAEVEFKNQQAELAERVARTMSEVLIEAWRRDGSAGVARILREGGPLRNLGLNVRVVELAETAGLEDRPRAPVDEWRWRAFNGPFSTVTRDDRGEQHLHTYVPLRLAPGRRGALEFAGSLEPLERQTWRAIWMALATIGFLAILSVAIAYGTGVLWVARPLEALIAKTERIGRGDFSQPLQPSQPDELGELAVAINRMCDRLAAQQAAIAAQSAERIAALEQLRHVDRLKTVGRLAAGIAHELGTPLNVVAGRAALIASGKLGDYDVRTSAETIKSEADRITRIVRQLLDFARRRPPQRTVTDLHGLVEQSAELLRPLAEKQNVQIETARPEGAVTASVDVAQLEQVLTNVLVNAMQAMPNGGLVRTGVRQAECSADAGAEGADDAPPLDRYVAITIADEGAGISPDDLEHIFEPFFTTKDVGEGTGLGLSIAYGIVEEHGGWIDVDSAPGEGSSFTIYLPRGETP